MRGTTQKPIVAAQSPDGRSRRSCSARIAFEREVAFELVPQIRRASAVFAQFLRKQPLCQAGQKHDLEHTAPGLMRTADEDSSVPVRRGIHFGRQKPIGENIANLE